MVVGYYRTGEVHQIKSHIVSSSSSYRRIVCTVHVKGREGKGREGNGRMVDRLDRPR